MVAFRMWLDKQRRLRALLRKREERLYRQLEARFRKAWCSWESEDGVTFTIGSGPQAVLTKADVEEVFRRKRAG